MVKYTKTQSSYVSIAPPPVIWIYQCQFCKFFIASNDCQLVCRAGNPDYNIISATAFCLLWNNKPEDPPFGWIARVLNSVPQALGAPQECVVSG